MSLFTIPGSAFEGISALGSTPPEAGHHAVKIVSVEANPKDKPNTYRVYVQFENGFRMFDFLHLAYDKDGKVVPGLTDKQIGGRTAALLTILSSLGFSHADVSANGMTTEWLPYATNGNRQGYVEFTPGQKGVANSYSNIESWVTQEVYENMKGKTVNDAVAQAQATQAAPAMQAQAPAPTAAIPGVPSNGAGVPAPAVAVALPPSPAQTIVGK